ncbi:GDSL-like Lipase/Acylhydrolase [Roseimaritima multifibrata]|uniref:GDSL-like Lipase/Acylhydrolase n=1 Tax=Roseimaritima multifibrata TaxID=1930274 RepID=A0A517MNC6_9BACT|nr:SGNH/GDSL hydrolase family protein [Roseimaritima multifibrata]QDS96381.1 GDSL-like Lipase/Acylhydrolase [Roseimaritima multifibrata]
MSFKLRFAVGAILLVGFASGLVGAQDAKPVAAKKTVADQPMKPVQEDPDLPRVLLIGDSISIGYTVAVRANMKGEANVIRPLMNCGPTTRGIDNLEAWLGEGKWDVIHFNFGLHDLKHVGKDGKSLVAVEASNSRRQVTPEDYRANLQKLVDRLKQTGAELIWCSTTPVPEGARGRNVGDSVEYNAIAAEVMEANQVAIDDLYTFAKEHKRKIQKPADVHYTAAGSAILGAEVAAQIRKALKSKAE